MIKEITSNTWPDFCRQISSLRAGAIVKLEVVNPEGVKAELAANATFESLIFDDSGACNAVITVHLRGQGEIVHEIIDPIQITLHPTETPGDFNPLQIKSENGLAFLTFHPAIRGL